MGPALVILGIALIISAAKWLLEYLRKANAPSTSRNIYQEEKSSFFRAWKNSFGLPEIEGIEKLSDRRINEIYIEVKGALQSISSQKHESISESVLNGVVRDLLIEELRGNYSSQLSQMVDIYSSQPISSLFYKGRKY